MNSGEIARLAGVSVRTLRHYHQVGVLPEPARRGNGYREYTVRDLILLLRVRRLAELGLSLDEIPALLDADDRAGDVLDRLDAELAAQIERLTARRAVIARLRAAGARPDLPPELAGIPAADGVTPEAARVDRELSILFHHLLDEPGRHELAGLLAVLSGPGLLEALTSLANRFAALDESTPAAEVDRMAADGRAVLEGLPDDYPALEAPRVEELFAAYGDLTFNGAQQEFLARMVREFRVVPLGDL
ncbi:MerR family transcriptional regulator [Catenuloplanes japonicus]|uniref:MerR family transcriptional regulator n=1 Tax=Catenuloplanes japonicus TaxID=33876 RepID=UPI000525D1D3|nr:MerR family transcriptional regulator [Catenuloplanes japonicus]